VCIMNVKYSRVRAGVREQLRELTPSSFALTGSLIVEPASVTASFRIITIASHATTTPDRSVEYPAGGYGGENE